MVDLCLVVSLVFKWWSENQTSKSLFMVQNVWYLNGLPSHVTLPFEYRKPILSSIQVFSIQRLLYKIMHLKWGSEYQNALVWLSDCSDFECDLNFKQVLVWSLDDHLHTKLLIFSVFRQLLCMYT